MCRLDCSSDGAQGSGICNGARSRSSGRPGERNGSVAHRRFHDLSRSRGRVLRDQRRRAGKAGWPGIDPAFAYAFRKTGRLLTEENVGSLTTAELAKWNEAIDEYHSINGPAQ